MPCKEKDPAETLTKMHNGSPPLPSPDQACLGHKVVLFCFVRKTRKTLYIILSGITLFFYF